MDSKIPGKIYALKSHLTDKVYIGSTIMDLKRRFSNHQSKYRFMDGDVGTAKELLNYPDVYIELLEDFPCATKKQLLEREGYWISSTYNAVNDYIAGRDEIESRKAWYQYNRTEKIQKVKARQERIKNWAELPLCM